MAGELVTGPGLIQWGTLLLGRRQAAAITTPYRWRSLSGWEETPALDSGTVNRAQQHGAWPGRLLAQPRTITLDPLTVRTAAGAMGAAIRALNAACPIGQDEQPLVIQIDERGPLMVYARLIRRHMPVERTWQLGWAEGGALQWQATDPRRYDLTEQVLTTGLPQPGLGLDWADGGSPAGLDWHDGESPVGLDWGADVSNGNVTCVNSGDAEAHPLLEIRGPITTPSVLLVETGQVLEYDITLAASDVLTVDTWNGTVTLASGASRLYTVTARSSPEGAFVLPASSTSTLALRAPTADPTASLTVRFRSAYW